MNSFQFVTIFFAIFAVAGVKSLGTLVTLNGAATIPLLTGTAGTLAGPLAVLGALKLLAAAIILGKAGSTVVNRKKRSVVEEASIINEDSVFDLISSMDLYGCGKQLICELEAMPKDRLLSDELLILTLFGDRKSKKSVNPASSKAEYDLAAELGMASKNQFICRKRYSACPYTADQMMNALRESNI